MNLQICPHCQTRVVSQRDGTCPSCRHNIETNPIEKPSDLTREPKTAYGATSLKLALAAFALMWVYGKLVLPVIRDTATPATTSCVALASVAIVIGTGWTALAFGTLSLMGYGKRGGTSQPIQRGFGMLGGLIYGPLVTCGLLLPAIQRALN